MTERETTQADTIRLAIESEIFNGSLVPGASMEEGRLAARFGVSRTPVREAITQLVQAGLISKSAHRRAVVSELDPGTLLDLFEALSELEGSAAFLSTTRMSRAENSICSPSMKQPPIIYAPKAILMITLNWAALFITGSSGAVTTQY